ncbi:hypothetical protein NC652_000840 [Populus alba x Populus x berolinensis]|nr:hypothetical protein NC652_000840 [Populus alba x Populus x berolinensis]
MSAKAQISAIICSSSLLYRLSTHKEIRIEWDLLSEILSSILIGGNKQQSNRKQVDKIAEFMDLIVEKPHKSPLSATWLGVESGLLLKIILSRSRHSWCVAVYQFYDLWQMFSNVMSKSDTPQFAYNKFNFQFTWYIHNENKPKENPK